MRVQSLARLTSVLVLSLLLSLSPETVDTIGAEGRAEDIRWTTFAEEAFRVSPAAAFEQYFLPQVFAVPVPGVSSLLNLAVTRQLGLLEEAAARILF